MQSQPAALLAPAGSPAHEPATIEKVQQLWSASLTAAADLLAQRAAMAPADLDSERPLPPTFIGHGMLMGPNNGWHTHQLGVQLTAGNHCPQSEAGSM